MFDVVELRPCIHVTIILTSFSKKENSLAVDYRNTFIRSERHNVRRLEKVKRFIYLEFLVVFI